MTPLGISLRRATFDEQTPAVLLVVEPWFVLGGLAYGGMALDQHKALAAGAPSR